MADILRDTHYEKRTFTLQSVSLVTISIDIIYDKAEASYCELT